MGSIRSQTRLPNEHWIVDGSNNAEIKEFLGTSDLPPYVKWISEPDKGISDAFNKGVRLATQEVVHILNSGDYYFDENVLENVLSHFDEDASLMWVHGQFKQFIGNQWVVSGKPFVPSKLHMGMGQVAHPTMFLRQDVYDRVGFFDVDLKDAMDFDFLIRIRNEKFKYLQLPLSVFTPGGTSSVNWKRAYKKSMRLYEKHFGKTWKLQLGYFKQLLIHGILDTSLGKALLKRTRPAKDN